MPTTPALGPAQAPSGPVTDQSGPVGVLHLCRGPAMDEVRRDPDGTRWCFICRRDRAFDFVVHAPVGLSYYGPSPSVRCSSCNRIDADLFPGRSREWE